MKKSILSSLSSLVVVATAFCQNDDTTYIKKLMVATEERFNAREESLKTLVDLYNQYESDMDSTPGVYYVRDEYEGYGWRHIDYDFPYTRNDIEFNGYDDNFIVADGVPYAVLKNVDFIPPLITLRAGDNLSEEIQEEVDKLIVRKGGAPEAFPENRLQTSKQIEKLDINRYLKDFWNWKFSARKEWIENGVNVPKFTASLTDYAITVESETDAEFKNTKAIEEWDRVQADKAAYYDKLISIARNPIVAHYSSNSSDYNENKNRANTEHAAATATYNAQFEEAALQYFQTNISQARQFKEDHAEINGRDKYIHATDKVAYINQLEIIRDQIVAGDDPLGLNSGNNSTDHYTPLFLLPTCGAEFQKATIPWAYESPSTMSQKIETLNQIAKVLDSLIPWYRKLPNSVSENTQPTVTNKYSPLLFNNEFREIGTVSRSNFTSQIQIITQRLHDFEWVKWPLLYKELPYGGDRFFEHSETKFSKGESEDVQLSYDYGYFPSDIIGDLRRVHSGYSSRTMANSFSLSDYASTAPAEWKMYTIATTNEISVGYDINEDDKLIYITPLMPYQNNLKGFQNIQLTHRVEMNREFIANDNSTAINNARNELNHWVYDYYNTNFDYYYTRGFTQGHQALSFSDHEKYEVENGSVIDSFPKNIIYSGVQNDEYFMTNYYSSGPLISHTKNVKYGAICKPLFNQELPQVAPSISNPANIYTGVCEETGMDTSSKYKGVYFSIPSKQKVTEEAPMLLFNISTNNHLSSSVYNTTVGATGLWSAISIFGDVSNINVEHADFVGNLNKIKVVPYLASNGSEEEIMDSAGIFEKGIKPISRITYDGGYMSFNWRSLYHVEISYFRVTDTTNQKIITYEVFIEGAEEDTMYCEDINSGDDLYTEESYGSLIVKKNSIKLLRYRNCEHYNIEKVGSENYEESARVEYFDENGKVEYARLYSYYTDFINETIGKGIETIDGDIYESSGTRTITNHYLPVGSEFFAEIGYQQREMEPSNYTSAGVRLMNHQLVSDNNSSISWYDYYHYETYQHYLADFFPSSYLFPISEEQIANENLEYNPEFLTTEEGQKFINLPIQGNPKSLNLKDPENTGWSLNGDVIELNPNGSLKSSTTNTSGLKDEVKVLTK